MVIEESTRIPVWIIGDSHVSAFAVDSEMIPEFPFVSSSVFPDVQVCRLGPQLAATLVQPQSSTRGRQKTYELLEKILEGARVFLLFGEIDCSAHIVRRAGYNDEFIDKSVTDTIKKYFSFITEVLEKATERDLQLGVISPPPTSAVLHPSYLKAEVDKLRAMSQSPLGRRALRIGRNLLLKKSPLRQSIGLVLNYAGTEAQRRRAGNQFTAMLNERFNALNLAFIDMYTPFISPDGQIRKESYWDEVHLKQAAVAEIADQFEDIGVTNFSLTGVS